MAYAYRKQPLKSLYLLFQLITLVVVRFPLWAVLNIPKIAKDPCQIIASPEDMEFEESIYGEHTSASDGHGSPVRGRAGSPVSMPDHTAVTSGPGVRGIWVEPANELVTGDLKLWAKTADVSSIRIPGYWIHKVGSSIETAAPAQPGEKVILQLHGGAYIRLSAHPKDPTAQIAKGYVKEIDSVQRVFSPEYRLASGPPFKPAHPFPTQLLDALAGYNYLVNVVQFAPENIIVSGDSAGGNLAYALTRYLTEYQGSTEVKLPGPPGGLILLSPWIDLGTTTQSLPEGSATKFLVTDYIGNPNGDLRYAKAAFSGPHGLEFLETNPYISPASLDPALVVDFKKFPPTFIVAGGAEVLYDSIIILKDHMTKDLGDKVHYFEALDGVHDFLIFSWHEPERTNALKEIHKWLQTL